jgi:hypothetical protein
VRLVASDPTDVFIVNGGTVVGQGAWASFSETLSTFTKHFSQ